MLRLALLKVKLLKRQMIKRIPERKILICYIGDREFKSHFD